jgi:hypothetical protein
LLELHHDFFKIKNAKHAEFTNGDGRTPGYVSNPLNISPKDVATHDITHKIHELQGHITWDIIPITTRHPWTASAFKHKLNISPPTDSYMISTPFGNSFLRT